MPLFVIQKHRKLKTNHFDLMLERGGKLATWSCQKMPLFKSSLVVAEKLLDHRLIYLTYEGKISRGRGSVTIWDKGTYLTEVWRPRLIIITLQGKKIQERFLLFQPLSRRAGQTEWWIIQIKRD